MNEKILSVVVLCGAFGLGAHASSPSFAEYTQRFEATFATPEAAQRATVSAADLPPGKAFAFSQRWDDANPRHLKMADVLDPLGIKATFYVNHCRADFVPVMTNLVARGHSLGDHTVAHDFMPLFLPVTMFREIMDCRIFIETESQTPVAAFGFPYGKTSMETDPEASRRYGQALTNAGILGSPQKKENPFEILGGDPSRWVATHYFSINDKDPNEKLFRRGMDWATNLALKAEGPIGPHVTMGTHTWQSDEGLLRLSKILSSIAGRSDIWFVNENEWIAARLQKLSARFRRISVRDRTAVYEVTRPEPSELGAAMPLFLAFSEQPLSVRTAVGADVLKAGLPVEDAHLPPKHYRRLPADALTVDDARAQVTCSFRNDSESDWSGGVAILRLPPGYEPGTVRRSVGPLAAGGETNISFAIKRSANAFNDGFYAAVQIDLNAPEGKTRLWARVERTNDALPLEGVPRDTCTAAGPFPVAADPGPKFFAGLSCVGSPLTDFAGEAGVWRAARRVATHHPSVGDATQPGWTRYTAPGHRLAVAYDLDADVAAHGMQWKLSLAVMNQEPKSLRIFLNGQEVSAEDPLTLVEGRNRILFVHDFGKVSNFLHELTIVSEKDGTSAKFRRCRTDAR